MNRIFVFLFITLLISTFAAPFGAASDLKNLKKRCFDSQAYALVPCPKSGKPMAVKKEKPPQDAALSFLRELQPYTKFSETGEQLSESAEEWAMVRDNKTGLMWAIKSRGRDSIHFYAKQFAWNDLQQDFIEPLNEEGFGGFSDWRLPTAEDLSSLMITSTRVPIVNLDFFPYTRPDSYWTGLFRADTPDYACNVDFYLGNVHYSPKSQKNFVYAVRTAQDFRENRKVTLPTEKFQEPREGITDSPPNRKGETVPFRRMPGQQRQ